MRPQRGDPAPAPTARLRRAASVTAPAQRHRPCPDPSREQEALAPAVPCFWRKGRFWTIRMFLTYRVHLPAGRGQGKQGGSWHLGPPSPCLKAGCPQAGRRSPCRHTCCRLLQTHLPGFALWQSERQQTQRADCQLAPVWRLIFACVHFQGKRRRKPAPPRPPGQGLQAPVPAPAPAPRAGAAPSTQPRAPGKFRGLLTCVGDGEVFRYQ